MAIDLRGHEEAARMLYVLPFSRGFSITSRRTILYQSGSLPSFQLGFEWYGSSVAIEWIPDEEMAAKLAVIDLYIGVEPGDYEFIPYLDGHLFLLDARSSFDPDPANLAAKLYGGPVIDRAFLQEFIRTLEEDPVLEETAGDARKEWQELLDLIEENPAKFEWTWLMPPYSADPAADRRPNEDFLRRVEGESVYTHYSIDLDGDGRIEHILHNHTPTLGRDSPEGYWAVYTETEAGLRLIGHSSTGSSSLIYGQDHFYYLSPPLPREDGWVLDAQLHPIPSLDEQEQAGVRFVFAREALDRERLGMDLEYPRFTTLYLKYPEDGSGGQELEIYMADSESYQAFHDLYRALPEGGLVFRPSSVTEPFPIQDIRDYIRELFPQLPMSEEEGRNTVEWEEVLALPRPLDYGKIEGLFQSRN